MLSHRQYYNAKLICESILAGRSVRDLHSPRAMLMCVCIISVTIRDSNDKATTVCVRCWGARNVKCFYYVFKHIYLEDDGETIAFVFKTKKKGLCETYITRYKGIYLRSVQSAIYIFTTKHQQLFKWKKKKTNWETRINAINIDVWSLFLFSFSFLCV